MVEEQRSAGQVTTDTAIPSESGDQSPADDQNRDALFLYGMSPSAKKDAIQHLVRTIPDDTFEEIAEAIRNDPDWRWNEHFGIGLYVRNLLRKGEIFQGDPDKDWADLIENAVKEKFG